MNQGFRGDTIFLEKKTKQKKNRRINLGQFKVEASEIMKGRVRGRLFQGLAT